MSEFTVLEAKKIPYYEETSKRTFKQKLRKVRNTLCFLLAYACPLNGVRKWLHRQRGVKIGKNVYIGMFVYLDNLYPEYIYINDNASINAQSMVLTHFNPRIQMAPIFPSMVRPVVLKEGAVVAVRCTIMPGVTIGQDAFVSGCSVVENDVPDYALVKGSPAKVVANFKALFKKQ